MTELAAEKIQQNYQVVRERLSKAAGQTGRDIADIRLITVTKGHSVDVIRAAYDVGARDFGENYVQEALAKMNELSMLGAQWHMIGHVQSRKAREVAQNFTWLQTIDSLKLAQRCDRFAFESERILPVLLECNVSGEASKQGWPAWDEDRWLSLADELRPLLELNNLEVRGLMTMPPYNPDPNAARPYFRRLRRLRDFLSQQLAQTEWKELSMGMSHDFETAVEEGATMVRVGTAIVGVRGPA